MPTPDYDAIVIGAGHNGLVCAGYLARGGMNVLVVERRPFVGGAAVTEEIFPGYRLSACSYHCYLLQDKVVDDFELRRHGFDVYQLDPKRFSPYPDGRHLLFFDSLEATQEQIAKFSPEDAKAVPRWNDLWKRAAALIYPWFLTPPPSLDDVRANARKTGDGDFLERLLTVSMTELVNEHFQDPVIRSAFTSAQDVGCPSAPGSAWCYNYYKCGSFTSAQNSGLVKGGMSGLTEALAASVTELGVTIRTGAAVERVLVEDGQATGIRLTDGDEITAAVVVSNADPKRTFLQLVGREDVPPDFYAGISNLKTTVSYFKFHASLNKLPDFSHYLGDDFDPRSLAMIKIAPSVDYMERAWRDAREGRPPAGPIMEVQIPSVYDDTLAPPGDHVLSIWALYAPVRPAEGTWDELRQSTGEHLIRCVAEYAPGFEDCINDSCLFTPLDIQERVGLTDGNIRHLDIVPDQYLDRRPLAGWSSYATPVRGLYLCGGGTHPGGEVSGAPGHNAAGVILDAHS